MTDGFELFSEYEKVKRHMMMSSMLTAHIAAQHASPDAYILFNSSLAAYDHTRVPKIFSKPAALDFVANSTIAKQALDLGANRTDE